MMNYFFYVAMNIAGNRDDMPDTLKQKTLGRNNLGRNNLERNNLERNTWERDPSECVKNTHSQIALRSIWATIRRFIRGGVRYDG